MKASFPNTLDEDDEWIGYFCPDKLVAVQRGSLPHWRQNGGTYFVTFRCADALPQTKLRQWREDLRTWLRLHPEPHGPENRREFHQRFSLRIQNWLDSGYGACLLRKPANRHIVETGVRYFERDRYILHEFTVAANHVHALVTPLGSHELSTILHSWKSYSANRINRRERREGTFWQKESFDHIVRSPPSFEKYREYIRSHG